MHPDQAVITEQDVEAFDVDQPLMAFYDRCVRDAARAAGVREGDVRRWIGEDLITSAGTRALFFWDPLGDAPITRDVVVLLDERYLIRAERRGHDIWYELAHDRWVDFIRASNLRWRAERSTPAQRQLEERAEDWARRPAGSAAVGRGPDGRRGLDGRS